MRAKVAAACCSLSLALSYCTSNTLVCCRAACQKSASLSFLTHAQRVPLLPLVFCAPLLSIRRLSQHNHIAPIQRRLLLAAPRSAPLLRLSSLVRIASSQKSSVSAQTLPRMDAQTRRTCQPQPVFRHICVRQLITARRALLFAAACWAQLPAFSLEWAATTLAVSIEACLLTLGVTNRRRQR